MVDINRSDLVKAEMVRQTLKLAPVGIVATVLNALLLVLVLWNHIAHAVLIIWLSTTICLALLRSLFLYRHRATLFHPAEAALISKWIVVGLFLSGAVWGCAGIFLFPADSPTHQVLIVFVLCGMVAGAAGTFSSQIETFIAFSLPALVPIFVRFLIIGGAIYNAMSAMTLLYIVLTLIVARRISITNRELIELKERFAQTVQERTTELLHANEQLKLEMEEHRNLEEERLRLEKHLQQAHKMEAIATLAGGIAHQFNNALFVITGYIDLLEQARIVGLDKTKYIRPMKSSVRRMAELTDQLLAYARGGKHKPRKVSLSRFVRNTLPLINHTLDPAIKVKTSLPEDVHFVEADFPQLQMVLFALVTNAAEAIEGSGTIRITTGNQNIDEEYAKKHPGLSQDQYVCLTVQDNGKGMDEETLSHVFEPFFTTKFQGRGLGMAAAYGIVRNHGGWIAFDSKPGEGTIVRILLPAAPQLAEERKNK